MGKTSRRKAASPQREKEDLRKKSAMLPFLLVFGGAWLAFGLAALGTGYMGDDRAALTAGVAVSLLGVLMLLRFWMLRRGVLARLEKMKGE